MNYRFLLDLQKDVHRGLDNTVNSKVVIDGIERTGFSGGGFPPVGHESHSSQVGMKKSGKPQMLTYWEKTTTAT